MSILTPPLLHNALLALPKIGLAVRISRNPLWTEFFHPQLSKCLSKWKATLTKALTKYTMRESPLGPGQCQKSRLSGCTHCISRTSCVHRSKSPRKYFREEKNTPWYISKGGYACFGCGKPCNGAWGLQKGSVEPEYSWNKKGRRKKEKEKRSYFRYSNLLGCTRGSDVLALKFYLASLSGHNRLRGRTICIQRAVVLEQSIFKNKCHSKVSVSLICIIVGGKRTKVVENV